MTSKHGLLTYLDRRSYGVRHPLAQAFPSKSHEVIVHVKQDHRKCCICTHSGAYTVHEPVVRRLTGYGFFFDWIETHIDPVLFRSVFEALSIHDFTLIEGDLLRSGSLVPRRGKP